MNEQIMHAVSTVPQWAWHKIPNIEAALINVNKPKWNTDFVKSVPAKYNFEELIYNPQNEMLTAPETKRS